MWTGVWLEMLQEGATPLIKDMMMIDTTLTSAVKYGHTKIVQLLMPSGARLQEQGTNNIMIISHKEDMSRMIYNYFRMATLL